MDPLSFNVSLFIRWRAQLLQFTSHFNFDLIWKTKTRKEKGITFHWAGRMQKCLTTWLALRQDLITTKYTMYTSDTHTYRSWNTTQKIKKKGKPYNHMFHKATKTIRNVITYAMSRTHTTIVHTQPICWAKYKKKRFCFSRFWGLFPVQSDHRLMDPNGLYIHHYDLYT